MPARRLCSGRLLQLGANTHSYINTHSYKRAYTQTALTLAPRYVHLNTRDACMRLRKREKKVARKRVSRVSPLEFDDF